MMVRCILLQMCQRRRQQPHQQELRLRMNRKYLCVGTYKGALNDTADSAFTDTETAAGSGDDKIQLANSKVGATCCVWSKHKRWR